VCAGEFGVEFVFLFDRFKFVFEFLVGSEFKPVAVEWIADEEDWEVCSSCADCLESDCVWRHFSRLLGGGGISSPPCFDGWEVVNSLQDELER